MKVLIIGARGMLGQALADAFAPGNEATLWDREEIDITERESAKIKIKDLAPQIVINAAAYNNVDGAETAPEVANAINGYAVGYLAAACQELGIPLVHYSSEYVFDGTKTDGYSETDVPAPVSAYGRSKLLGEQELQKNTSQCYLIRLSRLFGQEAIAAGAKKSFVRLMLELAQTKSELEVVDAEVSCPTYAPDLARATRNLLEQKLPFGIYHCPNRGAVSWYGFAQEIFKIAGISVTLKPVAPEYFPRPAKRPAFGELLNTKLSPQRPWQEALKEFLSATAD